MCGLRFRVLLSFGFRVQGLGFSLAVRAIGKLEPLLLRLRLTFERIFGETWDQDIYLKGSWVVLSGVISRVTIIIAL